MDRKEMKAEAVRRMKYLGILDGVIEEFEKEDRLELSEYLNDVFPAVLYWTSNYEGLDEKIKNFEERFDTLVYHVILTHTEFGDMYSMLYVSDDDGDWVYDWEILSDKDNPGAYANVWCGEIEEVGLVGVKPAIGGVMRTW